MCHLQKVKWLSDAFYHQLLASRESDTLSPCSHHHHRHHHHYYHRHHRPTSFTWCKHTALQEHVTKSKCDMCCVCQKVFEKRWHRVFNIAQNNWMLGTSITMSGRTFQAHQVAATLNKRSPSVAWRFTGTTSVDNEDDCACRHDWTSVTRCRLSVR